MATNSNDVSLRRFGSNLLKIGKAFTKAPLLTIKAFQQATDEIKREREEEEKKKAAKAKKERDARLKKEKEARVRKLKANPAEALDERLSAIEKTQKELLSRLDDLENSSDGYDNSKELNDIKKGLDSLEGKLGLKDDPWHS